MTEIIQQVIRFIMLMLLQIAVFSSLQLFGYGILFLYIFFILFLPIALKRWQVLLIAFFTGFLLDITTGTYGLHMAAATFIGLLRNDVLRLIVGEAFTDDVDIFTLKQLTLPQFLLYTVVMSLLFCTAFFGLDYFSVQAIQKLLLQIGISTVLTTIALFIYRFLFTRRL